MATATLAAAPAPADDSLPRYIKVAEFAERFSISVSLVYELIAEQKIKAVKIGAATRIPVESVREFAASLAG